MPVDEPFHWAFGPHTRVMHQTPARMRAFARWYGAVDLVLAYKRCRPGLLGWLERAQIRLGAYEQGGVARERDREDFEQNFLEGPDRTEV